jgi:hypothetical protein
VKEVTEPKTNLLQEKSKCEKVPRRKPNEYNRKPTNGNLILPSLIISKKVLGKFKLQITEAEAVIISSLYYCFPSRRRIS